MGDTMSVERDEIATSGFALLAMTEMAPVESFVKIFRNLLADKGVDVQRHHHVCDVVFPVLSLGTRYWLLDTIISRYLTLQAANGQNSMKLDDKRRKRRCRRG